MGTEAQERNHQLELVRLELDHAKFRYDIGKWLIVAVGAVASFFVIDVGRLQLQADLQMMCF